MKPETISSKIKIIFLFVTEVARLIHFCRFTSCDLPVEIISAGWALSLLVEPRHDALGVEVVPATQEEYLIAFCVVHHANGTHKVLLQLIHLLCLKLPDELVFHPMVPLDLVKHFLVPDLLESCIVHANDRRVIGVQISVHDAVPLVVPVNPVQVVFAAGIHLDWGVVGNHLFLGWVRQLVLLLSFRGRSFLLLLFERIGNRFECLVEIFFIRDQRSFVRGVLFVNNLVREPCPLDGLERLLLTLLLLHELLLLLISRVHLLLPQVFLPLDLPVVLHAPARFFLESLT